MLFVASVACATSARLERSGFAGFSATTGVAIANKAGLAEDALLNVAKLGFIGLSDTDAEGGRERCTKDTAIGVVGASCGRSALLVAERSGIVIACGDTLEAKAAFESGRCGGIAGADFADLAFGGLASAAFVDFAVTVVVFTVADLGFWEGCAIAIGLPTTIEAEVEAARTKTDILGSSGAIITRLSERIVGGGDVVGLTVAIVILSVAIFDGGDHGVVANTAPLGVLAKLFSVFAVSAFSGACGSVVAIAAFAGSTSRTRSAVIDLAVAIVVLAVADFWVGRDLAFTLIAP